MIIWRSFTFSSSRWKDLMDISCDIINKSLFWHQNRFYYAWLSTKSARQGSKTHFQSGYDYKSESVLSDNDYVLRI